MINKVKKLLFMPVIAFLVTSIFMTQIAFAYSVGSVITSPTTGITNVGSSQTWT